MKSIYTRAAVLLGVLALPLAAIGQQNGAASSDSGSENIVVASKKSAREARQDLWNAEKEFYAIYNELNKDNDYDVRCYKDAPTGSVIKVQTCRPKFIDKAIRDGKVKSTTSLQTNQELVAMMTTFRENVNSWANSDAGLRAAAVALNQARADYAATQEAQN